MPTPGGPTKQRDRAAALGFEFADGEVFDDAALNFVQIVVIAVEDGAGFLEIDFVGGFDSPGELGEDLEIGADNAIFRGCGGNGRRGAGRVRGGFLF